MKWTEAANKLDDLRQMSDGWLDGYGLAPSELGLNWLEAFLFTHWGEFPDPFMYPCSSGDVMLEWDIESFRPTLQINVVRRTGRWHCMDLEADDYEWRLIEMEDEEDWQWFVQRLKSLA